MAKKKGELFFMGKPLKIFAAAALTAAAALLRAESEPWNDLGVLEINREEPHAFFTVADSFEGALRPVGIADVEKIYAGANYLSLNGRWKFFFADSPEQVRPEFFGRDFDDSAWAGIDVPGTWQTQGYDTISYTNTKLEFFFDREGRWLPEFAGMDGPEIPPGLAEPSIPEAHRQRAVYRTSFDLPAGWAQKEVFLKFGGVKSGFKLFVNGVFAGYSEDCFTPAEFNVTRHLRPGRNSVALEVYKFTTGSFFEAQDMPHTMGIFRDVEAVARPKVFLRDYYAVADLSPDFKSASLDVTLDVANLSGAAAGGVRADVFIADSAGKILGGAPLASGVLDCAPGGGKLRLKGEASQFELWSPDKPNLYSIVIRLSDSAGAEIESVRADFAFRKLEIRGREIFLNGVPFLIKGANRHNWSPDKGSAVDFKWLVLDCELMKRANINAIRTSHYPNDEKFLMLCSRYGFAVMDENNHETHDMRRHLPAENDKFVRPGVWRMRNLVMRDRNVPCVLFWSLGNESGTYHTKSHKAMEAEARALDPTRPVHSEPGAGQESNTSDFVSPMYGGMGRMRQYLNGEPAKPFIFCEYCFAQGNAIGNLNDIWDMMRSTPSLNGGFIWDWVDRTLILKRPGGGTYFADGRDFGTKPSAGTWCASGIVFSDRTLPSKYFEVQSVYADIRMDAIDAAGGRFKIKNEFVGTDLSEFVPEIRVEREGVEVARKRFAPVSLAPGKEGEFEFPLPGFDSSAPGEYWAELAFLRRDGAPFAGAGTVAASRQFFLKKSGSGRELPKGGSVSVKSSDGLATISAGPVRAVFDSVNPRLVRLENRGKPVISSPVEFDISSAWMDNHGRFRRDAEAAQLGSLKPAGSSFKVERLSNSAARAECVSLLANQDGDGFEVRQVYTVLASGAVQLAVRVAKVNDMPPDILLPRVGVRMGVPGGLSRISYFGRGPLQNYCDTPEASRVGLHKIDLSREIERYVDPQDCGNREGVRRMELADGSGMGMAVVCETPLPVSVLPYTQAQLSEAMHPEDLPEPGDSELRVAWKVAGVGNGALGPNTLEKYLPNFEGSVDFKFMILPLSGRPADLQGLRFPKEFDFNFERLQKNIRDSKLKPEPEGSWISEGAKVSYSSREGMYAPAQDTLLAARGDNFAFHTKRDEPEQWLEVDLGSEREITGCVIFNRKDSQGDRTDRLAMYVSRDGKNWREVWRTSRAKRSWTVNLKPSQKARYLKLVLEKKEYFHLSGLKIYGK